MRVKGISLMTVLFCCQFATMAFALSMPQRGMHMESVKQQFGAPETRQDPVGSPPISRWAYKDFTVYFEGNRVLHSVPHGDVAPEEIPEIIGARIVLGQGPSIPIPSVEDYLAETEKPETPEQPQPVAETPPEPVVATPEPATETGTERKTIFTRTYNEVATLPSFSMGAPLGLVPGRGVAFASLGGISDPPGTDNDVDGAFSAGIGFGDPYEKFGGALTLGIGSINADSGFGETGVLGLSFGRFFPDKLTGFSVGSINLKGWDDGRVMPKPSIYAAVTKILPNDVAPVILNAGIGNNGYRPIDSDAKRPVRAGGVFASAGVYVLPQVSLIVDYTSGIFSTGVSIVPVASMPLTLNLGAYDISTETPGSDSASFIGTLSYAYTF